MTTGVRAGRQGAQLAGFESEEEQECSSGILAASRGRKRGGDTVSQRPSTVSP